MPRKINQAEKSVGGKYRLLKNAGDHRANGLVYSAGEVIESDRPLNELYPNKFEVVESADGEAPARTKRPKNSITPFDTDETKKHPSHPTFELSNQDEVDPNADSDDDDDTDSSGEEGGEAPAKKTGKKKKGSNRR
jgi:hypothetical protein